MGPRAQGTGPFPLPAVEMPRPSSSRSRRTQQRARRAAAATALANDAIHALNSLHSSMSSSKHTTQSRNLSSSNSPQYSKPQLRAVDHILGCARRYVSRLGPAFSEPSSDDFLPVRDSDDLFSAPYAFTSDAVPLVADKVALPAEPGSCNLLDVLPPDLAQMYAVENPELFRPPDEVTSAAFAVLTESPDEYLRLIQRMDKLAMLHFTLTPKAVNGAFGAPKPDGSLRLIADMRPANAKFIPSPKVELPGPDLLSKLEVPEGETVFVCKSDLDNFYHRLRLPSWMWPYFALPPVRAEDVGRGDEFGPNTLLYPCYTTMPMGWSHSAFLAQRCHEHIVDAHTSLRQEDRITRTSDYRIDRVRHNIYIDDFGALGLSCHLDELTRLQIEYEAVMGGKRLPPKASKTTRPSSAGVECIGVEIHGTDLTAGVHPEQIWKLCRRTEASAVDENGRLVGVHSASAAWGWASR